MSVELKHPYFLPSLSKMHRDLDLSLWVPMHDQAIQIGLDQPDEFAELAINFDLKRFTVRRRDQEGIRIDEVFMDNIWQEQRRRLLVRPVGQFALARTDKPDHWSLTEGKESVIGGPQNLLPFFELLTDYSLIKQDKEIARAEDALAKSLLEAE